MSAGRNGTQRCSCQCHWDLGWLRFGDGKIGAGDVDGLFVVERGGYFLYIETKLPDEPVPKGQAILLEQLSTIPRFYVLLVRGPKSHPETVQRIQRGVWGKVDQTSRADFQKRVSGWYEQVNGKTGRLT